jgi:hypothetical protein
MDWIQIQVTNGTVRKIYRKRTPTTTTTITTGMMLLSGSPLSRTMPWRRCRRAKMMMMTLQLGLWGVLLLLDPHHHLPSAGVLVRAWTPITRLPPNKPFWRDMAALATGGLVLLGGDGVAPAAAAMIESPPPSPPAVLALQIQVDVNGLKKLAQQVDAISTVRTLVNTLSPYVKISQLPSAKWDFVRDVVAGDALITVNGVPIDVSVASAPGQIDVALNGFDTDFTLSISNTFLPRLPFATKRTVRDGVVAEPAGRTVLVNRQNALPPPPVGGLGDRTDLDLFHRGWTNGQVIGIASLAVAAAYAGSYGYYTVENEQAEAEAERKQLAAAAKRKATAAAKTVTKPPLDDEIKTKKPNEKTKQQKKPTPVPEKKAARMDVKKPVIVVRIPEEEEPVAAAAAVSPQLSPAAAKVNTKSVMAPVVPSIISAAAPSRYVIPQDEGIQGRYALLAKKKK